MNTALSLFVTSCINLIAEPGERRKVSLLELQSTKLGVRALLLLFMLARTLVCTLLPKQAKALSNLPESLRVLSDSLRLLSDSFRPIAVRTACSGKTLRPRVIVGLIGF
eukprot:6576290-Prymnesium_polylepis.1